MLNQGLLEGNPSFSFLYLASSGCSLAGKWKNSSKQLDQHDRRPVDGLVSTGRHCLVAREKGKNKGEGGEMEGEGYCESGGIWMEWIVIPKEATTKLYIG